MKTIDINIDRHFEIAIEDGNCFKVAMALYTNEDPANFNNLVGLTAEQVAQTLIEKGLKIQHTDSVDNGFHPLDRQDKPHRSNHRWQDTGLQGQEPSRIQANHLRRVRRNEMTTPFRRAQQRRRKHD